MPLMCQEMSPTVPSDMHDRISILVVAPRERAAELERIVSHTRWRMHVVHSIHDALEAFRSSFVSVVLCEHRLPDGTWLDLMHALQGVNPSGGDRNLTVRWLGTLGRGSSLRRIRSAHNTPRTPDD